MERDYSGDLGVDGRIILKLFFKECGGRHTVTQDRDKL
jgi:hypothetical protein